MDTESKECLIKYVNNLDLQNNISNSIKRSIINYGKMEPITLYRGQKMNVLNSNYWFSTSSSIDIAKNEFAGENGIVFIIHIDDAMFLDVNLYLTSNDIGEHLDEQEFIVQGGGKFYTNSTFQNEGYVYLTPKLIETWYHIEEIETKMKYAAKHVKKNRLQSQVFHEFIKNEMAIQFSLCKLSDNIVQCEGYYENEDSYLMILEYSAFSHYFNDLLENVIFLFYLMIISII